MFRRWFRFLPLLAWLVPAPALGARAPVTVQDQYELGMKYMRRGYYTKALEQFTRIRNYHRDSPVAVKAELAIADLHFKKSEWDQGRVAYQEFIRLHPRNADLDYAVYRMGLCAYRKAPAIAARDQTWTRHAIDDWVGFVDRFPGSTHLGEVEGLLARSRDRLARKELRIARFYARREAWAAVASRLEDLLHTWTESASVPEALALLATARQELGQHELAAQAASRLAADHPSDRALERLRRRHPDLF